MMLGYFHPAAGIPLFLFQILILLASLLKLPHSLESIYIHSDHTDLKSLLVCGIFFLQMCSNFMQMKTKPSLHLLDLGWIFELETLRLGIHWPYLVKHVVSNGRTEHQV